MKIETAFYSETSVSFYWIAWRHTPEDSIFIVTVIRIPDTICDGISKTIFRFLGAGMFLFTNKPRSTLGPYLMNIGVSFAAEM
jgi:hypothetical protein